MMKVSSSIKHLKLITGEELICEVLDEESESILIKNALSLMPKTMNDGTKYFAFRTYMVYQDSPINVIMLFSDKIMSLAVPSDEMIIQYNNALKEMVEFLEEDSVSHLENDFKEPMSLDDFLNEMDSSENMMDSDTSGMSIN